MDQRWQRLLYLHYPVDADSLRPLLHPDLEIDEWDGSAWVSLIPLHMIGVHLRDLPAVPGTREFPELNLRTYVRNRDRSGVWFLSLDASSWFSVEIARRAFFLPYFDADMTFSDAQGWFELTSTRVSDPSVRFSAQYEPVGPAAVPPPGTFDHFLAERYCMYATGPGGHLLRGDITHRPFALRPGRAEIAENTVLAAAGVAPLDEPKVAYADGTHSIAWLMTPAAWPQRVWPRLQVSERRS